MRVRGCAPGGVSLQPERLKEWMPAIRFRCNRQFWIATDAAYPLVVVVGRFHLHQADIEDESVAPSSRLEITTVWPSTRPFNGSCRQRGLRLLYANVAECHSAACRTAHPLRWTLLTCRIYKLLPTIGNYVNSNWV